VPVHDGKPFPASRPAAGTTFGGEDSADLVFKRLAGAWVHHAVRQPQPLIADEETAERFYEAVYKALYWQWFAPNSPQWFNTGLHWAYGISQPGAGHYIINPVTQEIELSQDSYANPQAHACFIQDVSDDLIREGGILDLWLREARIFKLGSGSGANYSKIRGAGEKLSGGGVSSGMMSFLHTGDRNAGSIKSGGTTRRAARMIVVDVDHPEIEDFIEWKATEERKVAALVTGSKLNAKYAKMIVAAFGNDEELKRIAREARKAGVDGGFINKIVFRLENNEKAVVEEYNNDWDSEAYATVSGQNANNTVRILNGFMKAVDEDGDWHLTGRVDGKTVKTMKARELWQKIAVAAWDCADPGLHFADTINKWHTCLNDGEIRASNPCSEYLFLDDTGCNLASMRLTAFLKDDPSVPGGWTFDVASYRAMSYVMAFILETTVSMAQYPSRKIAERTRDYRTLGGGYADIGGFLMLIGVPYDSDVGRHIAAALASVMTSSSYVMSADFAEVAGAFNGYARNKEHVHRVMQQHADANADLKARATSPIVGGMLQDLLQTAEGLWSYVTLACEAGSGLRNAQATVIAPTGTIGFVMDCNTTGIEPDFALVKYKTLAGGGGMMIINECVERSLPKLGYTADQAKEVFSYVMETGTVVGAPHIREEHYAIFDCATGVRAIAPTGHVLMMGEVQKFISGAISKTVNMPGTATVKDVLNIHRLAYDVGVKAIAIYRDGAKLSQPLVNAKLADVFKDDADAVEEAVAAKDIQKVAEAMAAVALGSTRKLPAKRRGYTQKMKVGDHKLFLRTGEFPDGSLGEIFIDMHKEGSAFRALMNHFAMAISLGLQHGVPLEKFVEAFVFSKFEPAGPVVGHDRLKHATSLVDLIFRDLAINYLGMDQYAHVTPETNRLTDVKVEEVAVAAPAAAATSFKAEAVAPKAEINLGYTGEICPTCNSSRVIKTGTCSHCLDCHESVGGCV
jgi:ribonucleoside-diphosphate reductase alpha chain